MWNIKKKLIRSVKFPEPINCLTILNEEADLLVSHANKLSVVMADAYQLNANPAKASPSQNNVYNFLTQNQRKCSNILFQ